MDIKDIIKPENLVYRRTPLLTDKPLSYCPGCGHSIIHKLIAQVIDEMGIREKVICVPPAGCAVLAYNYLDIDMVEAPHGRSAAVATGIKRVLPQNLVFSYQGDGDLASIGLVGDPRVSERATINEQMRMALAKVAFAPFGLRVACRKRDTGQLGHALHRFGKGKPVMFREEAEMVARHAAAEAVIAALAILAVEARRLLAVEGAAGPPVATSSVRLALVPRHALADHVRNRHAVAYLIEEGV